MNLDFHGHARAALARAETLVQHVRTETTGDAARMSTPHRHLARSVLADLERRNACLREACQDLRDATADEQPARWRGFLATYEDFLDHWRQARVDLAREECLDGLAEGAALLRGN